MFSDFGTKCGFQPKHQWLHMSASVFYSTLSFPKCTDRRTFTYYYPWVACSIHYLIYRYLMFCDAYIKCTGVQHNYGIISGFVFLAGCSLVEVMQAWNIPAPPIPSLHPPIPPLPVQPHPPVFQFRQTNINPPGWTQPQTLFEDPEVPLVQQVYFQQSDLLVLS